MRILLVASALNSLTQRAYAELSDRGHEPAVHLMPGEPGDEDALSAAVLRHDPELIVAPMLRSLIPEAVWSAYPCLIVHPGPPGDRGPSSLDWAIHEEADTGGVTVLQAGAVLDGGDVWAWTECPLPATGKSDIYRNEVSDAAMRAMHQAVERIASGGHTPQPQHGPRWTAPAHIRPYMDQSVRRIDWSGEPTEVVLRKLRAADSRPGVRDELLGERWFLHGGFPEGELRGRPGELLATRGGAVCRATVDGAVWIPELRRCADRESGRPAGIRLPATLALAALEDRRLPVLPEVPAELHPDPTQENTTYRDVGYREQGAVGLLSFRFPGGAMSTDHCRRLLDAYRYACSRPTRVLVLGGGRDFFSNGIHLNVIEAAPDPSEESWRNIEAMDDLVEAVLTTTDRWVVAALGGNAAAGGVMLASAADEVWCREGVLLNPHYRLMGLYGSEYWTYSLPRRVGAGMAAQLTETALPVTASRAHRIGLVDEIVNAAPAAFGRQVAVMAGMLAASVRTDERIAQKKADRERDEAAKPLAAYREHELALMRETFFDLDAPYHALRSAFVRKTPAAGTPSHLEVSAALSV